MISLSAVASVLGRVIMVFGGIMLVPLIFSAIVRDDALGAYDKAALATFIAGFALWLPTFKASTEVRTRAGFLLAASIWLLLPAFGALPMWLYIPSLSFTDAYFEAMSGLTTTGATVLTGLDSLPPSINLWRHLLNWLGGMGIIVLAVAVLPLLGVGGMQLYKAETPGPLKESKLTPRIAQTAKALWAVYAGITLVCIVALNIAGMSWFDAVCHAFAALALGGFSTHDASVGFFNSPAIEVVLTVFQLIAGMNFATHYVAWRHRSISVYWRDSEAKAFLLLVLSSCLGAAFILQHHGVYPDFLTSLRHASFNLVTIATDCGFVSQDFGQWPIFVPMWMLFLSCVSVSSGSTGGGIKMIRTLILGKQALREMKMLLHPNIISPLKIGGSAVPNRVVFAVLGFIFLYFMSIVALTFLLLLTGLDFMSAFSAVIACINNAGPGLGQVGPASNYQSLSDFQTWICSAAMVLGRLEIFSLLVIFVPDFWRQ